MCDPVSIGLMAVTTISGVASANAAMESAYAQSAGSFLTAEEYMKQIKTVELQAEVEEGKRREEFEYFSSKNLASAATSGASIDSASFEAIRKRNERQFAIDESIAELNKNNARGQAAAQSAQHTRAGFAQIAGGKQAYKIGLLNTAIGVASNAPAMELPKIGMLNRN